MSDPIRNAVPHVRIAADALSELDFNRDGRVERTELDKGLAEDRVAFNLITGKVNLRDKELDFFGDLLYPKVPMDVAEGKPLQFLTHNLWAKPAPIRQALVPIEGGPYEKCPTLQILPNDAYEGCVDTLGRMQREASEVVRKGIHVMVAQEAFSDDVQPLRDAFPFSLELGDPNAGRSPLDVIAGPSKMVGSGLAVYSKFPILESDFASFKPCQGSDALANKGILFTRLYVPGVGPMDVYTTHMQDGRSASAVEDRMGQLEAIKGLMDKHNSGLPTVIAGDFNFTSDMAEYGLVTNEWGWRDLYDEANPGAPGVTASPKNPHNSPDETAGRVDFVFAVGPQITAEQANVVLDKPVDGVVPSDHYGVQAGLKVKGN